MHRTITAVLLSALLAVPAGAQELDAPVRQGFGISFGIGNGSAALSCSGCSSERDNGLSGYLRLGGYVSPTLFVGGETNGWVKSEAGVDQQVGFLNAVTQWYPSVRNGLYLKGGLGFAHATASDGIDRISTSGIALTPGVGYDWRLTRRFSLRPYANYVRSFGAEAKLNGIGTDVTLNVDVFQLGLGFSWH